MPAKERIGKEIRTLPAALAQIVMASLALAGCGDSDGGGGVVVPPQNATPTFSSPAAVTVADNFQSTIHLAATDAEGDALTFSITGPDANVFALSANGDLTFKTPPRFIAPSDVDFDNIYNVTASVSDGKSSATQNLVITVQRPATGITTSRAATGFVNPVAMIVGSATIVAQKDGTFYFVGEGGKRSTPVPLPGFAPNSLYGAASSPALSRFQDSLYTYYLNSSGDLVATSYIFSTLYGYTTTPVVMLPSVPDSANFKLYADYLTNGAGLVESIATTPAGTDDLAQDPSSKFGKIILRASIFNTSNKPFFASGVHNIAGASYYLDRNGTHRLAITDRGVLNDELNSVVIDSSPINLGWPFRDGNQTVKNGTPSGLLIEPLLTLPRNTATGHVLVGSTIIGSSVILAYQDGSFYTLPAVALTSPTPLNPALLVDRTTEFKPGTGSFGTITFIRASSTGGELYVMNTAGELYLVNIPGGAL